MKYCYSPYECEFYGGVPHRVRVVETTSLRVLSPIPKVPFPKEEDIVLINLVEWILRQNLLERPFITEILQKLEAEIIPNVANIVNTF